MRSQETKHNPQQTSREERGNVPCKLAVPPPPTSSAANSGATSQASHVTTTDTSNGNTTPQTAGQ